jgi:hypothetical protein
MIKVRIVQENGDIVEQEINHQYLQRWISEGILTSNSEICSKDLTGGLWKKVGDLPIYEKYKPKDEFIFCIKCGAKNVIGKKRCASCNSSFRPAGIIILSLLIIICALLMISLSVIDFTPTPNLYYIAIMISLVILAIGIFMGKYWAWVGLQVLCILNILGGIYYLYKDIEHNIHYGEMKGDFIFFIIALIINLPIIIYLRHPRVKAYCSDLPVHNTNSD